MENRKSNGFALNFGAEKNKSAMALTGYSGTPLLKKLGINPGTKLLLLNITTTDYSGLLESNISNQLCKSRETPDLVHVFVKSNKEFEMTMKKIKPLCKKKPNIAIWVSWYKKSSKIQTDISEDMIRSYALKNDLVDVKVCAVNEYWSGLKLVVPLAKRP